MPNNTQFGLLDGDNSGKLEPKEIAPAIVEMLAPLLAQQGGPPPSVNDCLLFAQVSGRELHWQPPTTSEYPTYFHKLLATTVSTPLSKPRLTLHPVHNPQMFDTNGDGAVDAAEWFFLVEFVIVMTFVEATKPKSQVTPEMRAKLPPPLQEMLKGPAFVASCMNSFDAIDHDGNEKLTGAEIAPHVLQVSGSGNGRGVCC